MMKNYWKEALLLLVVFILSIVFVRRFTKGDTLEDYAMKQIIEEVEELPAEPDTTEEDMAATEPDTEEEDMTATQPDATEEDVTATQPDATEEDVTATEPEATKEDIAATEPDTKEESLPYTISEISDSIFARMQGKSFPDHCTVPREDLRYLTVPYIDFNGTPRLGELVCNKAIAKDLAEIFTALYEASYPIQSIRLIDDYNADDDVSVAANNTSCFCYRVVEGTTKLSNHARGLAVDINPLYNPYVKFQSDGTPYTKLPVCAPYIDRSDNIINPYRIDQDDLCYQLFTQHGFRWGGVWKNSRDYQHFDKVK